MIRELPRRGVFINGKVVDNESAARMYDTLSESDRQKLTDEEFSDLALAAQEEAEDRAFDM